MLNRLRKVIAGALLFTAAPCRASARGTASPTAATAASHGLFPAPRDFGGTPFLGRPRGLAIAVALAALSALTEKLKKLRA